MIYFTSSNLRRTLVVFVLLVLSVGDRTGARPNPETAFEIVTPSAKKCIIKEDALVISGRISSPAIKSVSIYKETSVRKGFGLNSIDLRKNFASRLGNVWTDDLRAGTLVVTVKSFQGDTAAYTFEWDITTAPAFADLWKLDAGKKILQLANDNSTSLMGIAIRGWLRTDAIVSGTSQRWFNAGVSLVLAENAFVIIARNDAGEVVSTDSVAAYYSVENFADNPGSDFQKFTFHATPAEVACRECHKPKPASARDACSPCHDLMWRQRFTHTPAKQRKCVACHDSTSETYKIQKSLGSDADMCYTCHTKQKEEWSADTMKRHGPVDGGSCLQCHTPHGSLNVMHTVAPINKMCSSCHDKHEEFQHPVVNHPHQGVPERARPGRELSCSGCHNPHATKYDKMLRYGSGLAGCIACHPA